MSRLLSEASSRVDVASVRAAPDAEAEQVTQVLRGEPLVVEERRGPWARIRTAYDYPGWIMADALGGSVVSAWLGNCARPVDEARAYLGAPYEWGGMTERGIDCSGLVHMAYRRCGRIVPRDAADQEAAGAPVASGEERPGDLVLYGEGETAEHIAFWLGDGRILHATGREGATRVLEEAEPASLFALRRGVVRL